MIYRLNDPVQKQRAVDKFKLLLSKGSRVDLTEKSNRTPRQNRYFHLLCGYYGLEFGYSIEEVKHIIKTIICPDLYIYERKGNKFIDSTANKTKEEISLTIERFKDYSARNGLKLPEAADIGFMQYIEEELSKFKNRQYI